jgi:hypothetical protein
MYSEHFSVLTADFIIREHTYSEKLTSLRTSDQLNVRINRTEI